MTLEEWEKHYETQLEAAFATERENLANYIAGIYIRKLSVVRSLLLQKNSQDWIEKILRQMPFRVFVSNDGYTQLIDEDGKEFGERIPISPEMQKRYDQVVKERLENALCGGNKLWFLSDLTPGVPSV